MNRIHFVVVAFVALAVVAAISIPRTDLSHAGSADGTIVGAVVLQTADGKTVPAAAGVVVHLASSAELDAATKPVVRRISQKNRIFSPALTVIPKGSKIEFPNDDRIFHNVFSLSRAKRFDLGLYRDGDSRSVKFKRAGVIDVYCNIHPEMKAQIKVVPNGFHSVTDDEGRFRIDGIPAGSYELVAWNGGEVRVPVTISSGKRHEQELVLAPAPPPGRHTRKDGTPYRRYD